MIDRRILLASVASLLGLAAFRWLRASRPRPRENFEVEMTDAEWRKQLTPEQFEILRTAWHRAPGLEPAAQGASQGHLRLRRLRPAAICLGNQVRQRHRLAELLSADGERGRQDRGPHLRHAAHRSALPPLRRPSRPRLRRRAEADRAALLHGRLALVIPSGRDILRRKAAFPPAIVAGSAIVPRSSGSGVFV